MALPKYDGNTNYVRQLDDHVKGGADVVKYAMDKFGEEFKDWFNDTYLPALLSTEHNNSGADNIGTTPILEGADTVQKALEALLVQIHAAAIGQIPDGAITDVKLSNEEGQIKDRVTEIQLELKTNKTDMLGSVELKNLIKNGSFEDDFANWTTAGGGSSIDATIFKIGSKSYKRTTAGYLIQNFIVPSGHKIYGSIWHKRTVKNTGASIPFYMKSGGGSVSLNSNVEGWTRYSMIETDATGIRIGSYTTENGDYFIDGVVAIDLTATFGAGNEPNKEEMDEILKYYPKSLLFSIPDEIEKLKKAIIALGVSTDQIRKITLSTENPSGGSDGDIWIKYA